MALIKSTTAYYLDKFQVQLEKNILFTIPACCHPALTSLILNLVKRKN